jgi:cytochrome P450
LERENLESGRIDIPNHNFIPMIYIIALLLAAGILTFSLFFGKRKSTNPAFVKQLPGLPFIGSVYYFIPANLINTFETILLNYGAFVEFTLLGKSGIVVTDPVIGKEVLAKRPKLLRRTSLMEHGNEVLNLQTGLFMAEGHTWSRIRKSTLSSFSNLNVSQKFSSMTGEIFEWIKRIHEKSVANPNEAIDMRKECFSLTIRMITIVAFGLEISDPLCSYFLTEFQTDVLHFFDFYGESALYPYPRWTWKYSPQYKLEVAAVKANNRIKEACMKIIQHKRQLLKEGKLAMNCMIDSLIAHHESSNEKALTDEEIVANVAVFYIAGADTTAITLSWLCYFFSLKPDVLLEVEKETKQVLLKDFPFSSFDSNNTSFEKKFEALRAHLTSTIDLNVVMKQLPYMNAVLREGLRLGSPANFVGLESISEEPVVLSNGITLHNKDIVFVNQDGLHQNPKVFDNPRDFNPSRWFVSDQKKLQEMEMNYIPFGGGPRVCPGMSLAMNELYLAISILSLFFKMDLGCPKEEVKRITVFVAAPNKMPILFTSKTQL